MKVNKYYVLLGLFLLVTLVLGLATNVVSQLEDAPNQKDALAISPWILFPFALVIVALWLVFYSKPKNLNFGGMLILIGFIAFCWFNYKWFIPGLNVVNNKLGQPAVQAIDIEKAFKDDFSPALKADSKEGDRDSSSTASDSTHTRSKDEWVRLGTRVCNVGWNNDSFKNGWCKMKDLKPGNYRFRPRSSLQSLKTNGGVIKYPTQGVPASSWDENQPDFAEIFSKWSLVNNGLIGKIVFKVGDENPTDDWEITLVRPEVVYVSFNYLTSESNWKTQVFSGTITIDILRKKS